MLIRLLPRNPNWTEALPLALAHAASKCKGNRRIGFADYGRRLTSFWADRPDYRSVLGRSYPESVFGTFTLALDDIVGGDEAEGRPPCAEAETVMGVLALLAPEQIPDFLLWPLHHGKHAAMDEDSFDRALEELHQAGLVAWGEFEDGAPHLGVHRIVQEIMRARGAAAGRKEELAALAVKAVESTYDDRDSFASIVRNARWLPQAQAVLPHAPQEGADSWHTLWTQFQIGDLNVMRGSLALAIQAYRDGGALAGRLAQSDPSNAGWQFDLGISNERIGSVLQAQGDLTGALAAFENKRRIISRLAQSDPSNAGWQRDLSVSQEKIGDVLRAQGNLGEALTAYRQSLAVRERLAQSDPSNAGWQRDLWVSYWRMADMAEKSGTGDPREWWQKCHEQIRAMKQRGILAPPDEQFLDQARQKAEGGRAGPDAGAPAGNGSTTRPKKRGWFAGWFGG